MKKNDNPRLGTGFIQEACDLTSTSRSTFYRAMEKKEIGEAMSWKEISVLAKYEELRRQAEEYLKRI